MLVGVMFADSIYLCRLRTISTLGTVPCINSARELIRLNELCCLVNWLSICQRFSRLWESCLSMVFIHVGLVRFPLSGHE